MIAIKSRMGWGLCNEALTHILSLALIRVRRDPVLRLGIVASIASVEDKSPILRINGLRVGPVRGGIKSAGAPVNLTFTRG